MLQIKLVIKLLTKYVNNIVRVSGISSPYVARNLHFFERPPLAVKRGAFLFRPPSKRIYDRLYIVKEERNKPNGGFRQPAPGRDGKPHVRIYAVVP
jgi:hypothetical protein